MMKYLNKYKMCNMLFYTKTNVDIMLNKCRNYIGLYYFIYQLEASRSASSAKLFRYLAAGIHPQRGSLSLNQKCN